MLFHPTEQLTEQSDHDCSNLLLIFAASESADMRVKCSVEPTDMTPVGGEKRHLDVNEVKVLLFARGR